MGYLEIVGVLKTPPTMVTWFALVLWVALYVFVQIRFLVEAQRTAQLQLEGTSKGPFPSVNANVVIEVVKLSEVLFAVTIVTLQDLQPPLCNRVLVLKNSEALRYLFAGHILTELEVSFELLLWNLGAGFNLHFSDVFGYFLPQILRTDLGRLNPFTILPILTCLLIRFCLNLSESRFRL